jgi:D-glycero-alpha-D-manno-heptose-7-phosphate kinase
MDENWGNQRRLDDTMSTPAMMQIEEAVRAAGAWGLKATGSGAGGCLVILCPPEARSGVASAAMSSGAELLEFDFTSEGVAVWSQEDVTQQS